MTERHLPRLFADDAAIAAVGTRLIDATLPRSEWTHEAHLAATCWIVLTRPDIDAERELPGIIRRYNESVGGINDDHQGYHETITQTYLAAIRTHCAALAAGAPLVDAVNSLLQSPTGSRDYPLTLYSRERLFSVSARRGWIAPDIASVAVAEALPAGDAAGTKEGEAAC